MSEIFQLAIRIEENGEKFYREVVKNVEDEEVRSIFTYLADAEVTHKKIFEDMVSGIKKYHPPETYSGEYFAYLKAYADGVIFTQEKFKREITQSENVSSAIDFGIRRELESILYYQEMKKLVPEAQHQTLEKDNRRREETFFSPFEIERKTFKIGEEDGH